MKVSINVTELKELLRYHLQCRAYARDCRWTQRDLRRRKVTPPEGETWEQREAHWDGLYIIHDSRVRYFRAKLGRIEERDSPDSLVETKEKP